MATEDVLTPPERKPRKKAPIVAGTMLAVAATGGAIYWFTSRGKESTDDAQVEAHVSPVAARVTGQVKRVLVTDNQRVKAGDVLVELDDADYAVRVKAAKADLAAAQATLKSTQATFDLTKKTLDANLSIARGGIAQASAVTGSTQAAIDQAKADVAASESRLALAKTELDRTQRLLDTGAIPRSELDARNDAMLQAQSQLAAARARVSAALANRSNSSGTSEAARGRLQIAEAVPEQVAVAEAQVELAKAKVDQAQAALHQAELALGYTKVHAEIDGVVAKRTVEVGQLVSPDRSLLALVDDSNEWIVANFKETQLGKIKPGQRVKIEIDGFDDDTLHGTVDSLQAGTGSRFALLPPDNASGNFTKVTQRVPIKIVLAKHAGLDALALRPGMSAEVVIYTE